MSSALLGVASSDGIAAFDLSGRQPCEPTLTWSSDSAPHGGQGLSDFIWLSNGIFVSAGSDGLLTMLHTQMVDKKVEFPLPSRLRGSATVRCLSAGPERKDVIAGLSDGTLLVWNTKLAKVVSALAGSSGASLNSVSWLMSEESSSLDTTLIAAGSSDGRVSFFKGLQPAVSRVSPSAVSVTKVKFGKDVLASGDSVGNIRLFDIAETGAIELSKLNISGSLSGIEFDSHSCLWVTSSTGDLSLVDSRSGSGSSLPSVVQRNRHSSSIASLSLHTETGLIGVGLEEGGALVYDRRSMKKPICEIESLNQTIVQFWNRQKPLGPTPVADRIEKALRNSENFNHSNALPSPSGFLVHDLAAFRVPQLNGKASPNQSVDVIKTEGLAASVPPIPVTRQMVDFGCQTEQENVAQPSKDVLSKMTRKSDSNHLDLVSRIAQLEMQLEDTNQNVKSLVSLFKARE